MPNSVIFTTLQSIDDATQHVGIQVDFNQSIWTIQNNPKQVPLVGTNGKVFSISIAGNPATNLYLDDGATLVANLILFGPNLQKGDSGTGELAATDPAIAIQVTWVITSAI